MAEPVSGNSYVRSNYSNCPSCEKDWQLKTIFHRIFDYKCNKCLLLGYSYFCFIELGYLTLYTS
ncbi:DUF2310 family Zn-ribbon-containing protein [Rickettsia canadensis]|uniref:DUF2310 family Zn-ribbon-containing protein n=1 Tax=Rickettsia canadensis TaxID=788 RepID=UPI001E49600D|nr:DUF2310 family Zn-ribbon-containing protein [Rickettsia canadensis]